MSLHLELELKLCWGTETRAVIISLVLLMRCYYYERDLERNSERLFILSN